MKVIHRVIITHTWDSWIVNVPNIYICHCTRVVTEREAWDRGLRGSWSRFHFLFWRRDRSFLLRWPLCSYWVADWYVFFVIICRVYPLLSLRLRNILWPGTLPGSSCSRTFVWSFFIDMAMPRFFGALGCLPQFGLCCDFLLLQMPSSCLYISYSVSSQLNRYESSHFLLYSFLLFNMFAFGTVLSLILLHRFSSFEGPELLGGFTFPFALRKRELSIPTSTCSSEDVVSSSWSARLSKTSTKVFLMLISMLCLSVSVGLHWLM